MAKVVGPLFSVDARNKLADSIVYMGWKGIKTVRMWLKPVQRNTSAQGDVRLILGGLGRATKPVVPAAYYASQLKEITPPQQSWASRFVQYIRNTYMPDAGAYETEFAEYGSHPAQSYFDSGAETLGLTDLDIPYKGITETFTGGLMLYELAKYAIDVRKANPHLFNKSPYTKDIEDWVQADVNTLVSDLKTIS